MVHEGFWRIQKHSLISNIQLCFEGGKKLQIRNVKDLPESGMEEMFDLVDQWFSNFLAL